MAELPALAGVAHGRGQRRFGTAHGECRDADAAAVEHGQSVFAPVAALAEELRLGALEANLRRLTGSHAVGGNPAHWMDLLLAHQKGADFLLPSSGRSGAGPDD